MKGLLVRLDSQVEVAKTYKKFGSDTCNDSDACEQKECTPDAELRLLLLLFFLGVLGAMSSTCRIAGFSIRSRRAWSPVEDSIHTEDSLSMWRHNALRIYSFLSAMRLRGLICIDVCVSPKLEEYY